MHKVLWKDEKHCINFFLPQVHNRFRHRDFVACLTAGVPTEFLNIVHFWEQSLLCVSYFDVLFYSIYLSKMWELCWVFSSHFHLNLNFMEKFDDKGSFNNYVDK